MTMRDTLVADGVETTPEIEEFVDAATFWLDVTNNFHEQALAHAGRLFLRADDPGFYEYMIHSGVFDMPTDGSSVYESTRKWYLDRGREQVAAAAFYDASFREGLVSAAREVARMAKREPQPVGVKAEWETLCRSGGLVVRRPGGLPPTCAKSPYNEAQVPYCGSWVLLYLRPTTPRPRPGWS